MRLRALRPPTPLGALIVRCTASFAVEVGGDQRAPASSFAPPCGRARGEREGGSIVQAAPIATVVCTVTARCLAAGGSTARTARLPSRSTAESSSGGGARVARLEPGLHQLAECRRSSRPLAPASSSGWAAAEEQRRSGAVKPASCRRRTRRARSCWRRRTNTVTSRGPFRFLVVPVLARGGGALGGRRDRCPRPRPTARSSRRRRRSALALSR